MSFETIAARLALPTCRALRTKLPTLNSVASVRKLQQQAETHHYILTVEQENLENRIKQSPGSGLYGGYQSFERSRLSGEIELALAVIAEAEKRLIELGDSTVTPGRPFALTPEQQAEALERRAAGETLASVAQSYGVSEMTISRLARGVSRKKETS